MNPATAIANHETTLPLPTKKHTNSTTNGTTNDTNGIKLEQLAHLSRGNVVELPLKQNADELLVRSRSQYASYIDKDLTDLDIVTIFGVAWITTVRCFTPATRIYVESHRWTSVCQISSTSRPGSCCTSALDLSPEQRLKDLVRNVRLIRSGCSLLTEGTPPNTGRNFLTSAIRYGGDCLSVPDPVTSAFSSVCLCYFSSPSQIQCSCRGVSNLGLGNKDSPGYHKAKQQAARKNSPCTRCHIQRFRNQHTSHLR